MSAIKHTITDAEYEIMCILWRSKEKLTVADIIKELNNNDWTASTVATFMARLLKKGVISCDKKGKINYYFPVLKQSEYALDPDLANVYDVDHQADGKEPPTQKSPSRLQ